MDNLAEHMRFFHISARLRNAAEIEDEQHASHLSSRRARSPLAGSGLLPAPKNGERPFWEPPQFWYLNLKILAEAQKEYNKREGVRDIKFRMEVMDNMGEREPLSDYGVWLADKAEERKDEHDKSFWENFAQEVLKDMVKVAREHVATTKRDGRPLEDWIDLEKKIADLADEMDERYERYVLRGYDKT